MCHGKCSLLRGRPLGSAPFYGVRGSLTLGKRRNFSSNDHGHMERKTSLGCCVVSFGPIVTKFCMRVAEVMPRHGTSRPSGGPEGLGVAPPPRGEHFSPPGCKVSRFWLFVVTWSGSAFVLASESIYSRTIYLETLKKCIIYQNWPHRPPRGGVLMPHFTDHGAVVRLGLIQMSMDRAEIFRINSQEYYLSKYIWFWYRPPWTFSDIRRNYAKKRKKSILGDLRVLKNSPGSLKNTHMWSISCMRRANISTNGVPLQKWRSGPRFVDRGPRLFVDLPPRAGFPTFGGGCHGPRCHWALVNTFERCLGITKDVLGPKVCHLNTNMASRALVQHRRRPTPGMWGGGVAPHVFPQSLMTLILLGTTDNFMLINIIYSLLVALWVFLGLIGPKWAKYRSLEGDVGEHFLWSFLQRVNRAYPRGSILALGWRSAETMWVVYRGWYTAQFWRYRCDFLTMQLWGIMHCLVWKSKISPDFYSAWCYGKQSPLQPDIWRDLAPKSSGWLGCIFLRYPFELFVRISNECEQQNA